jgi:non-reducing end alpha-L-arabinofuranosidase
MMIAGRWTRHFRHVGTADSPANATAAPTTLDGHEAYGVYIAPGDGYRDDKTSGIATGDEPEGVYDVVDGTHFNNGCCFDFGNAETNNANDGEGAMEAIYYGNETLWDTGVGSGPWIMADMENGLFSGSNAGSSNPGDPVIDYRATAIVEGESNQWAILGGNAQSGGLSTYYSGVRPAGYNPMHKQRAILLGIGGDNSDSGAGTFYEGDMTSGYPSTATENAVQANIVAAGYGAGAGEVHAVGTGKCLDDTGSATTLGTQVIIWSCNGQANQEWNLNSNGTITGEQSGLCLDVTGKSTANDALVELRTCNGGGNQQWTLGWDPATQPSEGEIFCENL